jgi:subtilisin family serine protease
LAQRDPIPGEYIVVFHNNVTADKRSAHITARGGAVSSIYEIGNSFFGYAAKLNDRDLALVSRADEVDYIEQNQMMHAIQSCVTQSGATWGIDRIAEKKINLDGKYTYPSSAGSGVDAYIVDTGILTTHSDFAGTARVGKNFVTGESDQDCNGHGTHVAGTVGGTTYGVAKKVSLIAVKVLGCTGSGTNQGVINGINWVASQYQSTKRPSVANMSLGGGKSTATNQAVAAAVKAGVTMVVAAGNDNADACNYSPASELTAISVGATENANNNGKSVDARSTFSNFGTCVSIFAPGTLITSDWIGGNTAIKTISGTSMASPHVAGAVAVYLGAHPSSTPAQVKNHFVSTAGNNEVDLRCGTNAACQKSPNKFVYSPCA